MIKSLKQNSIKKQIHFLKNRKIILLRHFLKLLKTRIAFFLIILMQQMIIGIFRESPQELI